MPGNSKNSLSMTCTDGFGIGNDMWMETGNLMFPWRPDYVNEDVCSHNPNGKMLFVSHASIEALILPNADGPSDVLDSRNFAQLQALFDAAVQYMQDNQPEHTANWGFVSHIVEYAVGSKAKNPPDPSSLAALKDFLAYVDGYQDQGLVVYATASEIANLVSAQDQ
jgi:hypothetical protein